MFLVACGPHVDRTLIVAAHLIDNPGLRRFRAAQPSARTAHQRPASPHCRQVGLLILNAGILSTDTVAELDTAVARQQARVRAYLLSCPYPAALMRTSPAARCSLALQPSPPTPPLLFSVLCDCAAGWSLGGSCPADLALLRAALPQFEVNALGPLRVAHALLPNLTAAAAAAVAPAKSSSGGGSGWASTGTSGEPPCLPAHSPPKVALISSKMGSIKLTKQGGKNGSVGYR